MFKCFRIYETDDNLSVNKKYRITIKLKFIVLQNIGKAVCLLLEKFMASADAGESFRQDPVNLLKEEASKLGSRTQ